MSVTLPHTRRQDSPPRRVRHEVRDGIAVIVFSATASCLLALLITVLVSWGR